MLQCFGAARALPLLRRFRPALVTPRVQREQGRTAPPHAQKQFADGLANGWIEVRPPPFGSDTDALMQAVPGLSRTDAELLILARQCGQDLFTDEKLLARAAPSMGVTAYDVVTTILLLNRLGDLDAAAKKRLVVDIHMEDGRTFTPAELDVLGLAGLV